MPLYQYKAVDLDGTKTTGKVTADNPEQLYTQLRITNIFVIDYKVVNSEEGRVKIKAKELAEFNHQIGTMLASGISITRCMSIIVQRCEKKNLKEIYSNVNALLQQGILLSDALIQQGTAFPILMINMIRAGENSGQLDKVAFRLSKHYEKDSRLQQKVRGAMMYPAFLLVLIIVVVLLIFTFILPTFFDLFEGMDLPWNTKIMIALSKFLTQNWLAAFIITALIVLAVAILIKLPNVQSGIDSLKLKLPVVGNLMKTIYTARFARNLSALYASGMNMVQSLQICQGLIGNIHLEKQFATVTDDVKNGVPLSNAVAKVNGFDPKLASSIFVGEETGRIDDILDNMADSFDYEAEQATQKLTTLIEPIMIVVMAAIVGFVMLSVMLPIYQYYRSIG